jgi:hypothetical protein
MGAGVSTDFVFTELEEAALVITDVEISIQVPVTRMDAMGLSMPLSVLESARINSKAVLVPYRQDFMERLRSSLWDRGSVHVSTQ